MALQIFKTFDNPVDAYLLKTKLESEGIQCYLENEHMSSLYPVSNPVVGGIRLKIYEEDLDRAFSIYESQEQGKNPYEGAPIKCPQCGSIRIINAEVYPNALAAIFHLVKNLFTMNKSLHKRRCKKCNHEFLVGKDQPQPISDS
jgi:DNA-directed RNA polymerase subunit RPC12/RpoP